MEITSIQERTEVAERSKKRHEYSGSIQKLIDLSTSFISYCEEENRKGTPIVWYDGGSLYPLIYGCGVIPALFIEIFRYSGDAGIRYAQENFQIPGETCAMALSAIGQFYLRKDTTIKRFVGAGMGCEPLTAGLEFIKENFGYETFSVDAGFIPPDEKRFKNYKDFCYDECERLVKWLIDRPIDKELLRHEQLRFNRIQDKIRKILELRKEHRRYLQSVPMVLIYCGNGHYFGRPDEYEGSLDGIISELEALKPGEYDDAVVDLAWVGQRGSLALMEAIDDAKAALTTWYTAGTFDRPVRTDIDPFDAAVDYLTGDRYYGGTTEDKCVKIEEEIRRGKEKGLILYTMLGCSFGTIEEEIEKRYFMKRDLPSLTIANTFGENEANGQQITRINAFVEMLS